MRLRLDVVRRERAIASLFAIVLMGAVVFALVGPFREERRQGACADQLRKIFQALSLYTAEHGTDEQVPGFPLSSEPFGRPSLLTPYLKADADVMYCPNAPKWAKQTYGSTYIWNLYKPRTLDGLPEREALLSTQREQLQKLGSRFPILVCNIHDATYYAPKESQTDAAFETAPKPFVIELLLDGSVHSGRQPYLRTELH